MTEPLRIALPIHCLDPGGVERVALSLASQWRAMGHEVTVVLGRCGGPRGGAPGSNGLCSAPALDYWSIPTRWSTAGWETPWMVHSLYSYLVANRVDVLFCPGNTYAVVGAAVRLLLGQHAPTSVLKVSNALDRRDMAPLMRRGYALWLRAQGHLFDCAVALSEPMREEVRARMQGDPRRLAVIPNPILTRARLRTLRATPERRPSPWATRYLAAGRLESQKNYPLLLRAFARVARAADTLTIAGEGAERARLERLAGELGIAGQVRFAGHVAAIDRLLAEADCFVISSDYEGLPGVVVEALAAGLPVLATDCCVSMACLVEPGRTGLIVPPACEEALARGIEDIRALRTDAPRARAVAATYEVEGAAARYADLMHDLVRHRRRERDRTLAASTLAPCRSLDGRV